MIPLCSHVTVQHDTTHLLTYLPTYLPTYHYLIFYIFVQFYCTYAGFVTRVYILLIFLVSVMEKGNWSGLDRGFGYLRMYFEDLRCNDLSILLDMSIFFFLLWC